MTRTYNAAYLDPLQTLLAPVKAQGYANFLPWNRLSGNTGVAQVGVEVAKVYQP